MAKARKAKRAAAPVDPGGAPAAAPSPAESGRGSVGTLLRIGGTLLVVLGAFTFFAPLTGEWSELAVSLGTSAPFAGGIVMAIGIVMLLFALQREPAEPHTPIQLSILRLLIPGYNVYHLVVAFLLPSWRELDAEAQLEREARKAAGKGHDWRPLIVLCTGAVFLALMEYFGHSPTLYQLIHHYAPRGTPSTGFWGMVRDSQYNLLWEFVWWSGWRVLGFFLLPAIVLKLMGEKIADYGLKTRGFLEHAWIYGFFLCVVLVMVFAVSYEESFQTYYPFYRERLHQPELHGHAGRSWYDFWAWEVLYAAQFFSLEFFFRGFWVKACKTAMGSGAIFAMVVPYCMIHFGKPFPETLGAILAGVVLGTLALKTRSIWSGFLIHVSVAISMDMAALLQTTGLPNQWWP